MVEESSSGPFCTGGGSGGAGWNCRTNGHIWGNNVGGSSGNGFGNARSIDTWTYILGEEESVDTNVEVKEADLKITLVERDKDELGIDDEVTYTVKVKNGEPGDGGSDVEDAPFTFRLPPGFVPDGDPAFSGNGCGIESGAIVYDEATRTYKSTLDLPNGCEITYTFKATVTGSSDPEDTEAVATILRPNDVTNNCVRQIGTYQYATKSKFGGWATQVHH